MNLILYGDSMIKKSFAILSIFLISLGFLNYSYADTAPDLSILEKLGDLDEIKKVTNETISNATNITENAVHDIEESLDPIQSILDSINSIIMQIEQLWLSITGQQ